MTCGIYKITSPSGNCYVGSSQNIEARWYHHKHGMKRQTHHCNALNQTAIKYGVENLSMELLEECHKDICYGPAPGLSAGC